MSKRKTTQEFIQESKKIFGDNAYSYHKTVYNTINDRVTITCNTCNQDFIKVAHNHLSRHQGCHHCSNKNKEGAITLKKIVKDKEYANKPYRLYYIKLFCHKSLNTYYKIGIEDSTKESRWKSNSNYTVDMIYEITDKLKSVYLKEQAIKIKFNLGIHKNLWSYGGHTEMLIDRDFLGLDTLN